MIKDIQTKLKELTDDPQPSIPFPPFFTENDKKLFKAGYQQGALEASILIMEHVQAELK